MSSNPTEIRGESMVESSSPLDNPHITFMSNEKLDFKVSSLGSGDMDIEQADGFVGDSGFFTTRKNRKSGVWEDFRRSVENGVHYATCLHCGRKLSRGKTKQTSSMLRHRDRCAARNSKLKKLNSNRCDKEKVTEGAALWILMNGHPFNILEGFNDMMSRGMKGWRDICPLAVERECSRLYEEEKTKLKALLEQVQKVSLTIDMWKSESQRTEFMVIYGHWIDKDWKLQRRVLDFVCIPPPQEGVDISDGIVRCVKEWDIEHKIHTISLTNTLNDDVAVKLLKDGIGREKRLFDVRCYAHILNLMVQDSLSEMEDICEKIRDSVSYVGVSSERTLRFANIAQQLQIHDKKLLLDSWTRWDFTYEMLSCSLKFKEVFPRYQDQEPPYDFFPSKEDWERLEKVCSVLDKLWTSMRMLSSSNYPTSNLFLLEILKVKRALDASVNGGDDFIQRMVNKMKLKFDKYWDECSMLVSVAAILDPRQKMRMIEFAFSKMYAPTEARENIAKVRKIIFDAFEEYACISASVGSEVSTSSATSNQDLHTRSSLGWNDFDKYCAAVETRLPYKSELQDYLGKPRLPIGPDPDHFDCLFWWKENQICYPTLSQFARDTLAIPITTIASEDMFNAGSMEIDSSRASLSPKTLQVLICAGDWCRISHGVKNEHMRTLREYELPSIQSSIFDVVSIVNE